MRDFIIAGNWKMNKDLSEARSFISEVARSLKTKNMQGVTAIVAPAFPFLGVFAEEFEGSPLKLSAQDVSKHEKGAFTGEVSAPMLKSISLPYCIIGHSERRSYHAEDDALIREKLLALAAVGITPILCIGESLEERDNGETEKVIISQLEGCLCEVDISSESELIIAYEPVWAIGTGRTASGEQAQEVHALIRKWLAERYSAELSQKICILYGGSMKPENIEGLISKPDIDGGLIGGASLEAASFLKMIDSAIKIKNG